MSNWQSFGMRVKAPLFPELRSYDQSSQSASYHVFTCWSAAVHLCHEFHITSATGTFLIPSHLSFVLFLKLLTCIQNLRANGRGPRESRQQNEWRELSGTKRHLWPLHRPLMNSTLMYANFHSKKWWHMFTPMKKEICCSLCHTIKIQTIIFGPFLSNNLANNMINIIKCVTGI